MKILCYLSGYDGCGYYRIQQIMKYLNKHKDIRGASNSQHKANYGSAIDLDIDGYYSSIDNAALFYYIKENLHFDQLIWEKGNMINPSWVHVSYVGEGKNRKVVLRMYKDEDNKSVYIPFDL